MFQSGYYNVYEKIPCIYVKQCFFQDINGSEEKEGKRKAIVYPFLTRIFYVWMQSHDC